MPKVDNVGFGDCTLVKMQHFMKIVDMHLAITQAVLAKHSQGYQQCYRYIELTAGKGYSPDGQRGSPLVFLDRAEAGFFNLPYRADFIECEKKNINELFETLQHEKSECSWRGDLSFYHGKYEQVIRGLLNTKDAFELGLIFVDPSGDLPDFEVLHFINEMRPRMEILIYLASTNVKRTHQYTEKRLTDFIETVGKKYWLIRQPIPWDQFKWTFLLGSNTDIFKKYKKIDFYRLDSEQGQQILEKLNLTEKERFEAKQPRLL